MSNDRLSRIASSSWLAVEGNPLGVDDDGDGFAELEGDCDDTNPAVHAFAAEIVGNGVDEDCDGSDDE